MGIPAKRGSRLIIGKVKGKMVCVRAAPILRWAVYKSAAELRRYFDAKGWEAKIVSCEVP